MDIEVLKDSYKNLQTQVFKELNTLIYKVNKKESYKLWIDSYNDLQDSDVRVNFPNSNAEYGFQLNLKIDECLILSYTILQQDECENIRYNDNEKYLRIFPNEITENCIEVIKDKDKILCNTFSFDNEESAKELFKLLDELLFIQHNLLICNKVLKIIKDKD